MSLNIYIWIVAFNATKQSLVRCWKRTYLSLAVFRVIVIPAAISQCRALNSNMVMWMTSLLFISNLYKCFFWGLNCSLKTIICCKMLNHTSIPIALSTFLLLFSWVYLIFKKNFLNWCVIFYSVTHQKWYVRFTLPKKLIIQTDKGDWSKCFFNHDW